MPAARATAFHRARAGTIASSSGKAIVAPIPRSMVRRGTCLPAITPMVLSPRSPSDSSRSLSDRPRYGVVDSSAPFSLKAAVRTMPRTNADRRYRASRRLPHQRAHGRHIGRGEPPTQRVGHQVLREGLHQHVGAREQRLPQVRGPAKRRAVIERARRVHRHAVVPDAPRARHVEVVERQADRIDHPVTRVAGRVGPVLLHALANGPQAAVFGVGRGIEVGNVGRRGRRRRAEQHLHHPLAAEHRRCAVRVRRECQDAAVAEEPGRRSSGYDTRRNALPTTPGMR